MHRSKYANLYRGFFEVLAGKYGRKTENFVPTSLEEARTVQLEFQVLFD
jgi:hypothetical protein